MFTKWSARWTVGGALPDRGGKAAKAHTLAGTGAYLQECIRGEVFTPVGVPPGWNLKEIEVTRIKHSHRHKPEVDGTGEKLIIVVLQTVRPFTTSFTPMEEGTPAHTFTLDKEGLCYSLGEEALTNHQRTNRVKKGTASYVMRMWVGARS